MAYMEWSADLALGIPVIDHQHKRIIDYINALEDATFTGNIDDTKHAIEGLVDYTLTHFEFEEELQRDAGYPLLKAHKAVHGNFMARIGAYRERSKSGEDVAAELLSVLKVWLTTHIKGDDRDYVEYVKPNAKGDNAQGAGWLARSIKNFFT